MRLAMDGRCMQGHRRGMGVYAASLLAALARRADRPGLTVFLDAGLPAPPDVPPVFASRMLGGYGGGVAWEQVRLPRALGGFDLLHGPANVAPLACPCPVVLTIHDTIFVRRLRDISAATYPRQIAGHLYRRWVYPRCARRARAVLTVSEASKSDIVRVLRVPAERVTVAHEALSASFAAAVPAPAERLRAAFSLPDRYMLAAGAYEKRKNIPVLFEALRLLGASAPVLALIGAENLAASRYDVLARRLGIGERVRFLPYVSDADLKALHAGATAFCWPSTQEGFGLPLLEAMSCGTPVIVSDIPVNREIAGEAALYAPPESPAAFAVLIRLMSGDPVERRRAGVAGRARAASFSWDRLADRTMGVYRSAADPP